MLPLGRPGLISDNMWRLLEKLGVFIFASSRSKWVDFAEMAGLVQVPAFSRLLGFIEFLCFGYYFHALLVWGLASLVIHKLPRLWGIETRQRPQDGSNRRTVHGLPVFKYKGKRNTETSRALHGVDGYIQPPRPDPVTGLPMKRAQPVSTVTRI